MAALTHQQTPYGQQYGQPHPPYGGQPQYPQQQPQTQQQPENQPPAPPSYADLILNPPPNQFKTRFTFSPFLRREYRFGLDPHRKVCPLFMQGHCPMGNACPDKHAVSSTFNNLVCKHWLRSLCKKGDTCEFLHEYNLRKMPECNFFVRNGYCSNGEECLYLHVDPDSKIPSCPHYDNGFCPLGPRCAKKHVRRPQMCKFFVCGFCPEGRQCREGSHARWVRPQGLVPPTVKRPREEPVGREGWGGGGGGRGGFGGGGGGFRGGDGGGFQKRRFFNDRGGGGRGRGQ